MARNYISLSTLDWDQAGFSSRSISNWMLQHATLSSWKHFYHQPYKCDWAEATQKAKERKIKDGDYDYE